MARNKELNEQMRKKSQDKLIHVAQTMFAKKGYYNCKVSDIAREAGMSTGNAYWYYSSKEEILKEILSQGFKKQEDLLNKGTTYTEPLKERLNRIVDEYIVFCKENSDFFTILLAVLSHDGEEFLNKLGFDMKQISLTYHETLLKVLSPYHTYGNETMISEEFQPTFFFSFFLSLFLSYRNDWHSIPEQLIREGVLKLLGFNDISEYT